MNLPRLLASLAFALGFELLQVIYLGLVSVCVGC